MAKFNAVLPNDLIKGFEDLGANTEEMLGDMTKAGAKVVEAKVKASVPLPEMAKYVKRSRTYKTPTDGGINTKIYFAGYLPFKDGRKYFARRGGNGTIYRTTKGIPVAFLANMYEYGRSVHPFPKKPFFRKAFDKGAIEQAMTEEQDRWISKLMGDS